MANDPHWIEHAHLKRGAYGHHSAKQTAKDAKKGGKLGRRARLSKTLKSLPRKGSGLHARAHKALYGA
jgi:hypothetical protein